MNVRNFILLFLSLVSFVSFSQKKEDAYKLQFKVKGEKDTLCFLANYYADKQYLKDTAVCDSKGNFTFTGSQKLPGGVYLVVISKKRFFEIIIPNDKDQFFTCETDTANFVSHMKVTGSQENEQFYLYQNYLAKKGKEIENLKKESKSNRKDSAAITQKMISIDKEVQAFRSDFMKKNEGFFITKIFKASDDVVIPPNPNPKDSTYAYRYYKAHYFDNIDLTDDRLLRSPVYFNKMERYIKNMVIQIPDSLIPEIDKLIDKTKTNKEMFKYHVWYLNYTYEISQMMGMDAIFVHMAENYYLTDKVDWLDAKTKEKFKEKHDILKPLLIGKRAPNAYLADSTGKRVDLDNVKGKAIIMVFWDPNCGHCQKEMPKLHDLYVQKDWKNKGIVVYAASTERADKDWKKFIKEKKIGTFINVWDQYTYTDFRKMWDIYSTPVIYILDENHIIRAKRIGVDQLEEVLKNILKLNL